MKYMPYFHDSFDCQLQADELEDRHSPLFQKNGRHYADDLPPIEYDPRDEGCRYGGPLPFGSYRP